MLLPFVQFFTQTLKHYFILMISSVTHYLLLFPKDPNWHFVQITPGHLDIPWKGLVNGLWEENVTYPFNSTTTQCHRKPFLHFSREHCIIIATVLESCVSIAANLYTALSKLKQCPTHRQLWRAIFRAKFYMGTFIENGASSWEGAPLNSLYVNYLLFSTDELNKIIIFSRHKQYMHFTFPP